MIIAHALGGSARYIVGGGYAHEIPDSDVLAEWKAILCQVFGMQFASFDHEVSANFVDNLFLIETIP